MSNFITKDSGERVSFESGMVRDISTDKVKWHKVADGPMLQRWAELLTRGAQKYPDEETGQPNWMKACSPQEYQRFRESAFRHFMQWFMGDRSEDHAAAVFFNINGCEYTKSKLVETHAPQEVQDVEGQLSAEDEMLAILRKYDYC